MAGHSVLVALTLTTCPPLPPQWDSPTARRKSLYWAKVMRGSGSSRSHCLSTPVMAWIGKFSSLTAAGSSKKVDRAGECSVGRRAVPKAPHGAYLLQGPTCHSTHLSAVPAGALSCGWQHLTCGRGPQYTVHASPRVPEASPARWAPKPCHWLGCPRKHQSDLVQHLARSAMPRVGVRPGLAVLSCPFGLLCGPCPSAPHSLPYSLPNASHCRGQLNSSWAGASCKEHPQPLRTVSPGSCCHSSAWDPANFLKGTTGGPFTQRKEEQGQVLRCTHKPSPS